MRAKWVGYLIVSLLTFIPNEQVKADQRACVDSIDEMIEASTAAALIRQMIECIRVQAAEIERLKAFDLPPQPTDLPTGAIVAFPAAEVGERACPKGWTLFTEAIGRMIVGAGLPSDSPYGEGLSQKSAWKEGTDKRNLSVIGGEERVQLLVPEMPRHSHKFTKPNQQIPRGSGSEAFWHGEGTFSTDEAGENLPHNNMPPYIALYYCKKD